MTTVYLTGIKVNILLVTKDSVANNYVPEVYSIETTEGFDYTGNFVTNFGIDAAKYGTEAAGYCLHGI